MDVAAEQDVQEFFGSSHLLVPHLPVLYFPYGRGSTFHKPVQFHAIARIAGCTSSFKRNHRPVVRHFRYSFFSSRSEERWVSRWLIMLLRLLLYLFTGFVLLILAAEPSMPLSELNNTILLNRISAPDFSLIRFLVFFYFAVFLIRLLTNMMARIGKGNIKRWMLGMFDKPMEQERIFMFIDMKSSTSIAEKLDHKKFSHLIRDVFNDLQVVDNYQGEVYQYLGDGAVVTWDLRSGIYRNNCLRAFYAFQKTIRRRRRYYRWRYGQEPAFKAGAHAGKVMALQVGQIRRDISYNGDTINTAARIESKCNEYKQELLISGDLYELLGNRKGFTFRNAGHIKLDGKKQGVDLYKVKRGSKKKK